VRCAVAVVPWVKMVLPRTPERKARARNSFPAEIGNLEPPIFCGRLQNHAKVAPNHAPSRSTQRLRDARASERPDANSETRLAPDSER